MSSRIYVPGAILTSSTPVYLTTIDDNEDIWFEPHQTFTVIDCRRRGRDKLGWWVTGVISGFGVRTCLMYTGDFYCVHRRLLLGVKSHAGEDIL